MKLVKHESIVQTMIATVLAMALLTPAAAWAKPVPNRQRMMEKLETIKMWKLMDALNLDSATALKVFPIIKETDRKKVELLRKKRDLTRQIRDQIKNNTVQPEKIDALAARLFDLTEQLCTLSKEEYKKLKPVLTERQLAQYLLFQQRFRRELLQRWLKERRGRKPNRPLKGQKHPPLNPEP